MNTTPRTFGHGGTIREYEKTTGRSQEEILDFSANINPMGPPDWLRETIARATDQVMHYPDPACTDLIHAVAARFGASPREILAGNGSSELLALIPRALHVRRAIIPVPSYLDYAVACGAAGIPVEPLVLKKENGFIPDPAAIAPLLLPGDLLFLGHPANPAGTMLDSDAIRNLARNHPSVFFVVDEAFIDFADESQSLTKNRPENVIVTVSFTKMFAIPAIRLGIAVADPSVIVKMQALQPCWSVNGFAQAVGIRAAEDTAYPEATRKLVCDLRKKMANDLAAISGLRVFPSHANYLLCRIETGGITAKELAQKLLDRGIAIRNCDNYPGLDHRFFRLAVRMETENQTVVQAIADCFGHKKRFSPKKKTPALMLQGTCSNAGKSLLTAAFCRILLQDGFSVAPFKAQNMALNSHVTADGLEMGRAQVLQAQACRLEPDIRMNPVLLKPSTETGSQVIVNGLSVGNMHVTNYIQYKKTAFQAVKTSYDALAAEQDVMVLEGAGSPAEVNLKHHDIVNMTMARYADAKVLIAGDIDRGGVYASFVGTLDVLSESERRLVAGFIVNKFRGDASLLADAHDYMLRRTGKPVLGVVPFLRDHGLPEEDSVGLADKRYHRVPPAIPHVTVAVIDLPHVANFTDIDPLLIEPDVHLQFVSHGNDLGRPDAVVIPGSKNVMADAAFLAASGLGSAIRELRKKGTEIVGICAGFQLLGDAITDPHGIESANGSFASGIGLLSFSNTLEKKKTLKQTTATHAPSGHSLTGYEIHHGAFTHHGATGCITRADGHTIGLSDPEGLCWGTYLHGLFDADPFRRWWIDALRKRAGLLPENRILASYEVESGLERLAASVRKNTDINHIYRMLGLS